MIDERNVKGMTTAISVFSGGLDSILSVKVILNQGIKVIGVNFSTPFFGPDQAIKSAEQLGIELIIQDITDVHLKMLQAPRFGYGKNMNPCKDCHGMMLRYAGQLMEEKGAQFIITGEVLGQRPFSQNQSALGEVARDSGYEGYILRPLSAKLLSPTIPEEQGWVKRDELLDISGRGRKLQMELVKAYGIKVYPSPAGGCLLTDPGFSRRLKELWKYHPHAGVNDIELLKVGRHFRLDSDYKLIVGRNQEENKLIQESVQETDLLLYATDFPGPTSLLRGNMPYPAACIKKAAEITAYYGKGRQESRVSVVYSGVNDSKSTIEISPCEVEELERIAII